MEKSGGEDKSVAILATGTIAYQCLLAGRELNGQRIGATVAHFATVKPLDGEMIERLAGTHDALITVEEHQVAGGFGGAVAEYLSEHKPKRVIRLGIRDEFGQSGEPEELLKHYGLDSVAIVEAAKTALQTTT